MANPGQGQGGKSGTPRATTPNVGSGRTIGPPTGTPTRQGASSATGQGPHEQQTRQGPQSQLNPENGGEVVEDGGRETHDIRAVPEFPDILQPDSGTVSQGRRGTRRSADDVNDEISEPGLIEGFDPQHPARLRGEDDETRKMTQKGEQEVVPKQVEGPPTPPYAPSQNYEGQLPPPSNEMVTSADRQGNADEGVPGLLDQTIHRGTTYVNPTITTKQMQHGIRLSDPVRRDQRRTKLGRFEVQHPDNPPLVFAAVDRLQAIQLYRQHCGIIASDRETSVREVN